MIDSQHNLKLASSKVASLLLILIIIIVQPSSVDATTVWSDDFNDGNYNDWTVTKGIFAVSSIEGHSNSLLGNQGDYSVIHHDSDIAVGTWSFSLYFIAGRTTEVYFMATEEPSDNSADGYKLVVWDTGDEHPVIKIRKCVNGWDETLDQYISSLDSYNWISIFITRTADGMICLYTGGLAAFRFQVQDSSFSSSEYFGFCAGFTVSIDDVVVSDTVNYEPPTTSSSTTTTSVTTGSEESPPEITDASSYEMITILTVASGIGLVVVAAIVIMKRR